MMHTQKVSINYFMDQSTVDQLNFAANSISRNNENTKDILITLVSILLDNKVINKRQYNKILKKIGNK